MSSREWFAYTKTQKSTRKKSDLASARNGENKELRQWNDENKCENEKKNEKMVRRIPE